MNRSIEIIICPNCQGDGEDVEPNGSYELIPTACARCGSSGRLIRVIEFIPYTKENYHQSKHNHHDKNNNKGC